MSSKYFSIEYTGAYTNIHSFLNTRDWNTEVKNVGGNKLLLKLSENSVEELKYIIDMDMDELKGGRINQIKEISERDFLNFSENGFEIIHDHHHENKLSSENNLAKRIQLPKREEAILNQKCEKVSEEESREEISDRVAKALTDTILPSKSPLPSNDPFLYLTSPGYLKTFLFASTLIIFVLAMLD